MLLSEPPLSNGVPGKQRAPGRGTTRGAKPADNARKRGAELRGRATLVTYADARNLRVKRRKT